MKDKRSLLVFITLVLFALIFSGCNESQVAKQMDSESTVYHDRKGIALNQPNPAPAQVTVYGMVNSIQSQRIPGSIYSEYAVNVAGKDLFTMTPNEYGIVVGNEYRFTCTVTGGKYRIIGVSK